MALWLRHRRINHKIGKAINQVCGLLVLTEGKSLPLSSQQTLSAATQGLGLRFGVGLTNIFYHVWSLGLALPDSVLKTFSASSALEFCNVAVPAVR